MRYFRLGILIKIKSRVVGFAWVHLVCLGFIS